VWKWGSCMEAHVRVQIVACMVLGNKGSRYHTDNPTKPQRGLIYEKETVSEEARDVQTEERTDIARRREPSERVCESHGEVAQ